MKTSTFTPFDYADELGLLDEIWTGWKLRRGQLFDPYSGAVIGFRPEEIRAMPIHHQRIAALERELRQLKALSQPADEKQIRHVAKGSLCTPTETAFLAYLKEHYRTRNVHSRTSA